jgi:hypothetical protein
MRAVATVPLLLSFSICGYGQTNGINLAEYLKPRKDTLFYNCIYDSFHVKGLQENTKLVYRQITIGNETAYYISDAKDPDGSRAQLASFLGSAMIFRADSVWLAPLTLDENPNELTQKDFDHILPSGLTFPKPFELAKLKWNGLIMEVFIKDYQFEDLSIGDTILRKCLKLNLIVYDRSKDQDKATVWLSDVYGIVKWIRTTGREEVIDLTRL